MSYCSTCSPQQPEDQKLLKAKEDAKKDAITKGIPMAVYDNGQGAYAHIDAFLAYKLSYRVIDVVSGHSSTTLTRLDSRRSE